MSSFDDVKVPIRHMKHIFGDTFIPDYWIKDMKEEGLEHGLTQTAVIKGLKSLKFAWNEESQEYLIDDKLPPLFGASQETYDFLNTGCDMTGSPGHHEMVILNLLSIAYPVVPFNILRQVTHGPLRPPLMTRKGGILIEDGDVTLY